MVDNTNNPILLYSRYLELFFDRNADIQARTTASMTATEKAQFNAINQQLASYRTQLNDKHTALKTAVKPVKARVPSAQLEESKCEFESIKQQIELAGVIGNFQPFVTGHQEKLAVLQAAIHALEN